MSCRNIISFAFIFVAAVIATVHNDPHSITGSGPEVTDCQLTTETPDISVDHCSYNCTVSGECMTEYIRHLRESFIHMEKFESSTREPEQLVMETAAVDLGALLDAGDGAVITLVAGDTRLAAHRAVLVDRSPVFATTLQRKTMETSGGEVVIHDVEGAVLRQLLSYMYTLQAPKLPGIAPQLLAAADTYGLSALKAHCEQQVAAQLSVETAAAAAVLAVKHSCSNLRHATISFIKAHILHVMATRGWADVVNSQPEEIMKVMQLLFEAPVEASVPATGGSGTAPTTQPHSDHSGHRGQTPASAAPPTASLSTSPSDDTVSRLRAPAPATSDVTPTTQPDSDHSGPTPASAAPTTAARHTPTPDYAAVCPLWSLSAEEKNRRLIDAAKEGALEAVEALLAAGADLEAGGEWERTALHFAAARGHVEVARRLLAAGAVVEPRERSWQWTPLHLAACYGHVALVRLLVEEASADVNARDRDGWTPLHVAARWGKAGAAAALLQAGADRGATDNGGRTPLDRARLYNHHQLIHMLTTSS